METIAVVGSQKKRHAQEGVAFFTIPALYRVLVFEPDIHDA